MRLRTLLVVAVAQIVTFCAYAADDYLHIQTSDGWKVLNINQVDRITFTGGTMVATDAEKQTLLSVPTSEVKSMTVNDELTTGIAQLPTEEATAAFVFDSESAVATMQADGNFAIYDLSGVKKMEIPAVQKGQIIDLSGITPGFVILKSGDYTLKVSLK